MDLKTKWLSRSHCLEIFSCLEKIRLSSFCRKMILSSPSCVFLSFKKSFLEKISFEKMFSWRKTKLLLSPLDFCSIFILSKNSFLFFRCPLFFLRLSCYLFFLLFLIVFSGVCFSKQKMVLKNVFRETYRFFSNTFFWTFFGRSNIDWSKKECVQKLSFEFSSKNIP